MPLLGVRAIYFYISYPYIIFQLPRLMPSLCTPNNIFCIRPIVRRKASITSSLAFIRAVYIFPHLDRVPSAVETSRKTFIEIWAQMSSIPEASPDSNETEPNGPDEKEEPRVLADSPRGLSEAKQLNQMNTNGNGAAYEDDAQAEEEDDEEEDSESDDEGDSDDDDEEPALKYERIGGSLNDLLRKDSAASLAISNRLMVCASGPCFIKLTTHIAGTRHARWYRAHSRSQGPTN